MRIPQACQDFGAVPATLLPPWSTRWILSGSRSTLGSASGSPSTTRRSAGAPGDTRPRSSRPRAAAEPEVAATIPSIGERPPSTIRDELERIPAERIRVEAHRQAHAGLLCGGERPVGLLALALGLLDQRARVLLGVVLGDVVEGRERGHQGLAAARPSARAGRARGATRGRARRCPPPPPPRRGHRPRPSAWAATRFPSRCASSTTVRTSSRVSWAGSGSSSTTLLAPVAMILTKSAPAANCSRAALRTSAGPSAGRYMVPKSRQPGLVADTMRAQVRIRGPGHKPNRTACLRCSA